MRWINSSGEAHDYFPELLVNATLSQSGAEKLFAGASRNLGEVFESSAKAQRQGLRLPPQAELSRKSEHRKLTSPNVTAVLRGQDPVLRNEYVFYTAHLDGLGIGTPVNGDAIYNGAYDNAMGISVMLEAARALDSRAERPKRSILFLAVTGEEKELLGSDFFARHPIVSRDQIVANMNMDMPFFMFPLADVIAFGSEHSSLGTIAAEAAAGLGLRLSPDPTPEEVCFIRSDQFPFVKQGVPALSVVPGIRSADARFDATELKRRFRLNEYHNSKDDLNQTFYLESAATFIGLETTILERIANASDRPVWKPGDFFGETFGKKPGAAR